MSGEARPGAGSPVNHTGVEGATDLIIASKTATGEEESVASLSIMLLLLVLGFTMLLGSWLKSRGVTWLHQAGAALLLGMAGGLALVVQASKGNLTEDWLVRYGDYLVFDTEFFFLFLLPPIIFESGYALNGEAFFRNLGKIVYFAFPGTLLGAVTFGLGMYVLGLVRLSHPFRFANAMMFGSIIGATDPVSVLAIFTDLGVEENLFAVVFGESVLNDAVAVVLYRAFSGMGETFSVRALARAMGTFMSTFLGSTAIGVGTGLASALFFKRFKLSEDGLHREHPSNAAVTPTNAAEVGSNDKLTMSSPNPKNTPGKQQVSADGKDKYTAVRSNERDDPEEAVKGAVLEASVVALFPWIAYMAAEAIQLVGIVSILFCGIVMGHYTRRNLSRGGRALTTGAFGLMAQLSETFVFIYIGASVFLALPKYFSTAVFAVAMCFVSRWVAVFPGVELINAHTGTGLAQRRAASAVDANVPGSNPGGGGVDGSPHTLFAWVPPHIRTALHGVKERVLASLFHSGGPVPANHARMLWFSGLRGAMAFALALEAAAERGDDGRAILTGTLGAVVFTTLIVGGLTTRALSTLGIGTRGSHPATWTSATSATHEGGPPSMSRTSSATASAMERGGGGDGGGEVGNDDESEAGTRALLTSGRSDGGTHRRGGSASNLTASSGAMEPADVDYMEHARTIDKRYLTPLFTLQEGDRDGVN